MYKLVVGAILFTLSWAMTGSGIIWQLARTVVEGSLEYVLINLLFVRFLPALIVVSGLLLLFWPRPLQFWCCCLCHSRSSTTSKSRFAKLISNPIHIGENSVDSDLVTASSASEEACSTPPVVEPTSPVTDGAVTPSSATSLVRKSIALATPIEINVPVSTADVEAACEIVLVSAAVSGI
jgi:hypothetical protein